MSLLSSIATRALDGVDLSFDAGSALLRVLWRGVFAPDAKSRRGGRFAALSVQDVLVQEVALNANDAPEARRAIALDPERTLPLAPDSIVFDITGPLASDEVSARAERRFVLGIVRKDVLERLRTELPFTRRGGVEAFVLAPPALPEAALVFEDEAGRKRRRLRRAFTAIAVLVLVYASNEAAIATDAALNRFSAAANQQRALMERRIRVAEHDAHEAEATLASLSQSPRPRLAEVSQRLATLARTAPPDLSFNSVGLDGNALALTGVAYSPDAAELALRRTFERARVSFTTQTGEPPVTFQARIATTQAP